MTDASKSVRGIELLKRGPFRVTGSGANWFVSDQSMATVCRASESIGVDNAFTRTVGMRDEKEVAKALCDILNQPDLAALTRQRDGLVKLLEESMNVFLHDADCFKSSAAEHMAKKLKAALEAAKKEQG